MQRCFQLATLGKGTVAPNPMVGCVVVHEGKIIGEGYHRLFGKAHAEVNALDAVQDKSLLKSATLYVNLEPCAHQGKTPSCARRIVKEGLKKVIICNLDPNPKVAGKGVRIMEDAGIVVESGVMEAQGWELNKRFFTFFTKHRPYVILKWAQTKDGFLDGIDEKPLRISTDLTKSLVHKLRAEEMAILVGTNTAVKDNPSLHTRRWYGNSPLRLFIDRNLRVPITHTLYDGKLPTRVFTSKKKEGEFFVQIDFEQDIVPQILDYLYQSGIQSLIVEGGKCTLDAFIKGAYFDEYRIEQGSICCYKGTKAPQINSSSVKKISTYGRNLNLVYLA